MRWYAQILVIGTIAAGVYLARPQFLRLRAAPENLPTTTASDATARSAKIFAGGTVEGMQREISLKFEILGRLKEVHVRAGDHVAKGSVLAQLDPEIWELKFTDARSQLKLARVEHDRLVNQGSRIRQDELSLAEAKVDLAEGALRRERVLLEKTQLIAPTDGIILRVSAEPGELVGPSDHHCLLTLVNKDRTRVRAYVEEFDALKVAVGQKAVVMADGKPDQPYRGVVQSCSPYVAPKSHAHLKPGELVDIRVREVMIDLADGADLLIGLPVEVFIEAGEPPSGDSIRVYKDSQRAADPQTANAAPPRGRIGRQIADPKIRSAGRQAASGWRK